MVIYNSIIWIILNNASKVISDIKAKIDKIASGDAVLLAATSSLSETVVRIFENGKNTANGKIGSYDTSKEIYISDDQAPSPSKLPHKGKTGKTIKTSFFKNYKAFRDNQGRNTSTVNLRLKNDLQSDFSNSTILGKSNPIKVGDLIYKATVGKIKLKRGNNIDKVNGLEKKYGRIFKPTVEEEQLFLKVLEFETEKILSA